MTSLETFPGSGIGPAEETSPLPAGPDACPKCGKTGRAVPRKVFYQHLNAQGILEIFQWKESRVCFTPECEALYYSGPHWISHQRCNKPVGFKKSGSPKLYCYCFGYTAEEILKKAGEGREKPILDRIESYLQKGALLCESTNPTGHCCLEMIQELLKNRPV